MDGWTQGGKALFFCLPTNDEAASPPGCRAESVTRQRGKGEEKEEEEEFTWPRGPFVIPLLSLSFFLFFYIISGKDSGW